MSQTSCAPDPGLASWRWGRACLLAALLLLASPQPGLAQAPEPGRAHSVCTGPESRIGKVRVEVFDVFDRQSGGLVGRIEGSANALHVRTREHVVRRHLLFAEGDACDEEALGQTERNLRATGLFQKVEVLPTPGPGGVVDVTIRARDAWSLRVSGDYGHVGGRPTWEAGLSELNVAGSGAGIGVNHRSRFEADVTTAWFANDRILGFKERLAIQSDQRSDGRTNGFSLTRPFYSLASRWGHEISAVEMRDRLRLYDDGSIVDEYRRHSIDTVAGVAARVAAPTPTSVWRLASGFRFSAREYDTFEAAPDGEPGLPPSHRLAGPYLNLHFVEHRYIKRTGLFVPGRDVDVNLGTQVDIGTFLSWPIRGLETSAGVSLGTSISRGWVLPAEGILTGRAFLSGTFREGDAARGDTGGSLRAWWQLSPSRVRAILLETRWLLNPDGAGRLYLGGSPGLRGYREYAFWGTRSALVIVEERKYFGWTLAKLFQFGVAGFAEAGAIAGAPDGPRPWRIGANIGAGLRIAQIRAAADSAFRIDVAFPVVSPHDGGRRPQLVIGYRGDY